jgi:environmental stress-induced protein Ves
MRIMRAADYRSMPWANGGGTTREIARHPETGDWLWRLSLATVAGDGPFSALPGVQRALAVASGEGIMLSIDGAETQLNRYDVIEFAGSAEVTGRLIDGPVDDLNLMVRALASDRPGGRDTRPVMQVISLRHGDTTSLIGTTPVTTITVLAGLVDVALADSAHEGSTARAQHVLAAVDSVLVEPGESIELRAVDAVDASDGRDAWNRSEAGHAAVVAIGRLTT